jgi:hypothetical protein
MLILLFFYIYDRLCVFNTTLTNIFHSYIVAVKFISVGRKLAYQKKNPPNFIT